MSTEIFSFVRSYAEKLEKCLLVQSKRVEKEARFPTHPDIRKLWIDATGRIEWIPTKCSTICSIHFSENDYIKKKSGKRYLKPGASPHENVPSVSTIDDVTHAVSTSGTVSQTASTSNLSQAVSTVDGITSQNKRKLWSPPNALTSCKPITIINKKEIMIRKQRLRIKRIQAQNRRLKRKINTIEDVLVNIKEKFCLKDAMILEDTHILKNINLKASMTHTTNDRGKSPNKEYHYVLGI